MGDEQTTGNEQAPKPGTREALDQQARELGIANPDELKNADAVKDAIADAESETRYSHGEVLEESRAITGYSRHHMAGALHEDDRPTLTREQAKDLGDAFAKREQRG